MTRVLFAWEMGANLGHLARSVPVADRLRGAGHGVSFAVRDTRMAAQCLGRRFSYVQAPLITRRGGARRAPASYAEMLLSDGWSDHAALLGQTGAWLNFFALSRPDVLVADHAPGALLAARLAGLPSVAFGSGFEIPPAGTLMPCIRPWESIAEERLMNSEQSALKAANAVLHALNGRPLVRLADLFPASPVLASFPELDHYGARSDACYTGSIHGLAASSTGMWPEGEGRCVFAYLRMDQPATPAVLEALALSNVRALCVVPGAPKALVSKHATSRLQIFGQPVDMAPLLVEADAVVSYGGAGVIAESLLAGVPMVLIPSQVEQYLGAKRVDALGAGKVLESERGVLAINAALEAVLNTPTIRGAAQQFAKKYQAWTPARATEMVARAILDAAQRHEDASRHLA
ncbi:MAG: UDP-glucuronosyltransferase [Betaproteobacteria bacterium]|uniref:UDP-glucuronosyltransferase n=1 Tax=Candidatus Proximibacter danicus TaxID=2954365 RepID=A0A9D7K3L4_9PROT|nr:UDP-glucuronosyltransferase [Candidatus Proximibacter danicus]